MNRRGVLGMLGLGAAAGPVVAKEMIYKTSYPSPGLSTPAILSTQGQTWTDAPDVWDPVKQLAEAKREYERVTGDSSTWIADYVARELDEYHSGYSSFRFEYIDPDIRNMKSLSETTKIRMHFERKAKRRYELSKNNLFERIQQLLKEV